MKENLTRGNNVCCRIVGEAANKKNDRSAVPGSQVAACRQVRGGRDEEGAQDGDQEDEEVVIQKTS